MKEMLVTVVETPRFTTYSVKTLKQVAKEVFDSKDVFEKADLTLLYCHAWMDGLLNQVTIKGQDDHIIWPNQPGRPQFKDPSDELLPNVTRSTKNMMKHNTMEFTIHGIANAESYAIDLFWDVMIRYLNRSSSLPKAFFNDMVYIAEQEAHHFYSWANRLQELSIPFGVFPSNDSLWHCAEITADCILKRLAIVNLTHEAKGLDSYLKTKEKLEKMGDHSSLAILEHNIRDEIGHVALGVKWFTYLCQEQGLEPKAHYQALYRQFYKWPLRPPFNTAFRDLAGMTDDWYYPVSEINTTMRENQ